MSSSSITRRLLFGAWIALLGVGGAWLGVRLASRGEAELPPALAQRQAPTFLQASVASLPAVQLLGPDPVPVNSTDLLGHQGTVVLFLDMACDPCRFAASQWQSHRNEGRLGRVEVVGITLSPRPDIEHFRAELSLDFPIYQDATRTFLTRYGVDTFPWELVVNPEGTVVGYTGKLTEMGDLAALRSLD